MTLGVRHASQNTKLQTVRLTIYLLRAYERFLKIPKSTPIWDYVFGVVKDLASSSLVENLFNLIIWLLT